MNNNIGRARGNFDSARTEHHAINIGPSTYPQTFSSPGAGPSMVGQIPMGNPEAISMDRSKPAGKDRDMHNTRKNSAGAHLDGLPKPGAGKGGRPSTIREESTQPPQRASVRPIAINCSCPPCPPLPGCSSLDPNTRMWVYRSVGLVLVTGAALGGYLGYRFVSNKVPPLGAYNADSSTTYYPNAFDTYNPYNPLG